MRDALKQCLTYFAQFSYAPTFEEIYSFLKIKTSKRNLHREIDKLVKTTYLKAFKLDGSGEGRYYLKKSMSTSSMHTLGEYSIQRLKIKYKRSKNKIEKVRIYLKLLSLFPQIKMIGISGSVSMMNAKEDDDIDLFIICLCNRIWTARFISLSLSQLMGIRRKYGDKKVKDKICLNLFFDEQNLSVPESKQSEYVAHEVLQMKPIVVKDDIYMRYLDANKWVYDIFPNARRHSLNPLKVRLQGEPLFKRGEIWHSQKGVFNFVTNATEKLLKQLQLFFINRHRTSELISDTQLWFHPDDFHKKAQKMKERRSA
jgi:hypothetical protein